MMIATVDYPKGLPNPLREDHVLNPVQPFVRTGLATGRARQRRAYTSVPVMGTWPFIYSDVEARTFEAWFRDSLADGTEWFNIERRTPLGLRTLVCRFTAMYTGPAMVGRDHWRYDCPLEIWERPLMREGWGKFPGYILGASIIDMALNREWPEAGIIGPDAVLLAESGKILFLEAGQVAPDDAIRISQLPIAVNLTGEEYIPLVQSGETKRAKAVDISDVPNPDADYLLYYNLSKD